MFKIIAFAALLATPAWPLVLGASAVYVTTCLALEVLAAKA